MIGAYIRGDRTTTRLDALIRRGRPDEAEALNELIMRSLAHWGYDEVFLEANRARLRLPPEDIERHPVYCAEVEGTVVGVAHLVASSEDEVSLHHLFVEPAFIGKGIGRLLWQQAVEQVAAMGACALVFGADPNARQFYEHMGAEVVGENVSATFPGHRPPRMRYDLPTPRPGSVGSEAWKKLF